jgi:hypothetical protein
VASGLVEMEGMVRSRAFWGLPVLLPQSSSISVVHLWKWKWMWWWHTVREMRMFKVCVGGWLGGGCICG